MYELYVYTRVHMYYCYCYCYCVIVVPTASNGKKVVPSRVL